MHPRLCDLQIFNYSVCNAQNSQEVAGDRDIQAQLWDYYDKLIQGRPNFKNSPKGMELRQSFQKHSQKYLSKDCGFSKLLTLQVACYLDGAKTGSIIVLQIETYI